MLTKILSSITALTLLAGAAHAELSFAIKNNSAASMAVKQCLNKNEGRSNSHFTSVIPAGQWAIIHEAHMCNKQVEVYNAWSHRIGHWAIDPTHPTGTIRITVHGSAFHQWADWTGWLIQGSARKTETNIGSRDHYAAVNHSGTTNVQLRVATFFTLP